MNPIVGATVTLQATFRDIAGGLVDPIVMLYVRDPLGVESTPVPTNPSTGVFEYELTLDVVGVWRWRWEGESTEGTIVCEGVVCADASVFVGAS